MTQHVPACGNCFGEKQSREGEREYLSGKVGTVSNRVTMEGLSEEGGGHLRPDLKQVRGEVLQAFGGRALWAGRKALPRPQGRNAEKACGAGGEKRAEV